MECLKVLRAEAEIKEIGIRTDGHIMGTVTITFHEFYMDKAKKTVESTIDFTEAIQKESA